MTCNTWGYNPQKQASGNGKFVELKQAKKTFCHRKRLAPQQRRDSQNSPDFFLHDPLTHVTIPRDY